MIEIMIVVIIVGLLAAVGIPNLMRARVKTQRETCLNNLRQIDAAKQQWSIENKKLKGYPVTISDISPYIRSGLPRLVECFGPADATYLGRVTGQLIGAQGYKVAQ